MSDVLRLKFNRGDKVHVKKGSEVSEAIFQEYIDIDEVGGKYTDNGEKPMRAHIYNRCTGKVEIVDLINISKIDEGCNHFREGDSVIERSEDGEERNVVFRSYNPPQDLHAQMAFVNDHSKGFSNRDELVETSRLTLDPCYKNEDEMFS